MKKSADGTDEVHVNATPLRLSRYCAIAAFVTLVFLVAASCVLELPQYPFDLEESLIPQRPWVICVINALGAQLRLSVFLFAGARRPPFLLCRLLGRLPANITVSDSVQPRRPTSG